MGYVLKLLVYYCSLKFREVQIVIIKKGEKWRKLEKNTKLARKILKICTIIVKNLKEKIFSEDFLSRHRKAEKFFIRNVILTFPILIIFLMNILLFV